MALHHLSINPGSVLYGVPVLNQGWLFVDLFFVLSGYVIAAVHAESDATPAAARRFLIRRFFRLYPLHIATLGAALLLDWQDGTAGLPGYGLMVGMNLTMTQAWGIAPVSVLNVPSWSISTEWAAYLLFAWICLVTPSLRRRVQLIGAIGLASLVCLVVWRNASLDGDLLFRLPRCLVSFALGSATWAWCRGRPAIGSRAAAALQCLIAVAMFVVVGAAGREPHVTLLMPVLSAAMIVAMVRDPGSAARKLLELPVPQWLGRCSYSIYLLHMPLFKALALATPGGWPTNPTSANLWIIAALSVLFAAAALSYAYIERPWRELGRRLADARPRSRAAPAPAS